MSSLPNERFVRDFLQKSRVGSPKSASYDTSSASHTSTLQNERFVRDFLQKSHGKSPKRAFRTRLPPKVTRQVSKTSVAYKTSSKSHASSLSVSYETSSKCNASSSQNERLIRDLPPKVTRQVRQVSETKVVNSILTHKVLLPKLSPN